MGTTTRVDRSARRWRRAGDARAHGYCVYTHADWAHAYVSADGEHSYESDVRVRRGAGRVARRGRCIE